MAIISIQQNGAYVDLPAPSEYEAKPEEISKASRNTLGNLYKYHIATKRSITVSWVALSPSDKDLILSLTSGNSFNVKYFDIQEATFKYGKFYRGTDIKLKPYAPFKNGEFKMYDISFTLAEF